MPIRVLVVDDHGLMRQGLRALIEPESGIVVVGEAEDGRAALEKVHTLRPDVVLMDIAMAGLNGLEATRQLCTQFPNVRVIVLSMYDNQEYVLQSLAAGAQGYLLKQGIKGELFKAIQTVASGSRYLDSQLPEAALDQYLDSTSSEKAPSRLEVLTPREREILQLVAEGWSNPQIAVRLDISPKTVDRHRSNLMEKLDIHHLAGLIHFAIETGLIEIDR